MDQAGVDRALIHPVLWDPDSNELAVEAVQNDDHASRIAKRPWARAVRRTRSVQALPARCVKVRSDSSLEETGFEL